MGKYSGPLHHQSCPPQPIYNGYNPFFIYLFFCKWFVSFSLSSEAHAADYDPVFSRGQIQAGPQAWHIWPVWLWFYDWWGIQGISSHIYIFLYFYFIVIVQAFCAKVCWCVYCLTFWLTKSIFIVFPEKVWLLELNCNPALHTNCRVLKEVIPDAVVETLGECSAIILLSNHIQSTYFELRLTRMQ